MTLESAGHRLAEVAEGLVELDKPLAGLTTYRLGGPASLYIEPAGEDDLVALGAALAEAGSGSETPVLVLGRGSNVVISDEGFPGVVIRMGPAFQFIEETSDTGLKAGASTPLPMLANWAARRNLSGLEFAVGIPGSVGGAVRMNAGAHEGDFASTLIAARVYDLDSLELRDVQKDELGLTYRRSNLTDRQLVCFARLELRAADPDEIRARMDSFRRHRATTQPGALQNAGSTFKNPPGDSAGRLVEAAGLKGFRVGGVRVSELHANFFVASDDATAQDVYDLVTEVGRRVEERFGVKLEPEVRFVGPFEVRAALGTDA
ncbi:MAG: UDP-N-acetylmuramate dehydrogenase [Actinomycetota bacterium]|jgi:UDP-N-acetylmuramate dehydrogenase|nr:UDP-N-acetylmuramate dehydrogenase [Actinomycetota bacterium]